MSRVILVSHGELADTMLKTAELITGEKEHVLTFGLSLGDDVEVFRENVMKAIGEVLKNHELLLLTDIQSGSPFNVAVGAMMTHRFLHYTGMNLPMVVEALSSMEYLSLEEISAELTALSTGSIINVNRFIKQNMQNEQ